MGPVEFEGLVISADAAESDPSAQSQPPQRRAGDVELSAPLRELARSAAAEDAGTESLIGEYLGAHSEDDIAVTARFATTDTAYTGWAWCVTLAVLADADPTVSEVVLLPGAGALVAPAWLPWSERIRPGDLGPGDLLVPRPDDPRVVPGYVLSDDPAVTEVALDIGLGRPQVLSRLGRIEAAERWHEGDFGPTSEMAKAAPLNCETCAFYLPIAGSMRAAFGACANEMSPADGRVVHAEYGCGAHSGIVVDLSPEPLAATRVDDLRLDYHLRAPTTPPAVDEHLDPSLRAAAELIEEEVDAGAESAAEGVDQVLAEADAAKGAEEPTGEVDQVLAEADPAVDADESADDRVEAAEAEPTKNQLEAGEAQPREDEVEVSEAPPAGESTSEYKSGSNEQPESAPDEPSTTDAEPWPAADTSTNDTAPNERADGDSGD
jgi:Protein of unknown function (DUF3027)